MMLLNQNPQQLDSTFGKACLNLLVDEIWLDGYELHVKGSFAIERREAERRAQLAPISN